MERLKQTKISVQDYCDIFNVSEKVARNRIHKGELLARKIKGQYFIFGILNDSEGNWFFETYRPNSKLTDRLWAFNYMVPKGLLYREAIECQKINQKIDLEEDFNWFFLNESMQKYKKTLFEDGVLNKDFLKETMIAVSLINDFQILQPTPSNKAKAKEVLEIFDKFLSIMNKHRDDLSNFIGGEQQK